jgi:tRNA (guanine-N1)-methyltransferase
MRFDIVTLFPDMCRQVAGTSILQRIQDKGLVELHFHDPRAFARDAHKSVDDTPYGGGSGMVLRVDIFDQCLEHVRSTVRHIPSHRRRVILLTPQGRRFTQEKTEELESAYDQITLVCGHYEGFDERIRSLVDEQLSIGDFVVTGGELPALLIVDAVSRLIPTALTEGSPEEESFSLRDDEGNRLLEYPHYTRPLEYRGMRVPDVLLSGNHAAIAAWRMQQAKERSHDQPPL